MSVVSGIVGANAAEDAADESAEATRDAGELQADVMREMFDRSLEEYAPFKQIGLAALPQYQSAILGGPVRSWVQDEDGKWSQTGPSVTYKPQESPSAKYLTQQGTQAMNRRLASRGLSGSGQAATGLVNLENGIVADDYYRRLSLLGGLVDVGRGVATSTAGAAQGLGGGLSSVYGNVGAANANAAMQGGMARAGLYSGMGGAGLNTLGAGMRAYNAWNQPSNSGGGLPQGTSSSWDAGAGDWGDPTA